MKREKNGTSWRFDVWRDNVIGYMDRRFDRDPSGDWYDSIEYDLGDQTLSFNLERNLVELLDGRVRMVVEADFDEAESLKDALDELDRVTNYWLINRLEE